MIKKIVLFSLCYIIHINLSAQDLSHKIPNDAQILITLNGEAFYKQVNSEDFNKFLKKTSLFDALLQKDLTIQNDELESMGIDIHAKAYIHGLITDSVQFYGALLPIKDKSQFEGFLPESKKIVQVNGLNTIYSADGKTRISWDNETLYVLSGVPMITYFNKPEVQSKYGLLAQTNDYSDTIMDTDEVILEDLDSSEWDLDSIEVDSFAVELDEIDTAYAEEYDVIPEADITDEDYTYVDSVLEQEEYEDDYYLQYRQVENHNDSIKNILINAWMNERMNQIIAGSLVKRSSKDFKKLKDNEILSLSIKDLNAFNTFYDQSIYSFQGFKPKLNYGYDEILMSVLVDGNRLSMKTHAKMEKGLAKKYREIYKNKANPKFNQYLSEDILGFFSLNINTENYIKHLPAIVKYIYGYDEKEQIGNMIDLGSTLFDVLLDEKAIAKVFKGDNLFVLNGIVNKEVSYTDYEYDDDFNATEIQKTRIEKIPQFLFMFSSEDTRIFEKVIQLGINHGEVTNDGGIYEVKNDNAAISPFILMHDGIVFLGNDKAQLQAIQSNKVLNRAHKPFVDFAKKSQFSLLFNTKKLPSTLQELGVPIQKSLESSVSDLEKYGNFTMKSYVGKGDLFNFDMEMEFPNDKSNALMFIIDSIDTLMNNVK
ncbi:hypothetical protein ACFRAE_16650 [Sphingobacterium sp. HJSM2_6]|uniref:hypothetical protein n=1 Tax=Sphingobacterium sp. HJSM2_6 TaxID=3366264 RepID=UPI003BCE5E4C